MRRLSRSLLLLLGLSALLAGCGMMDEPHSLGPSPLVCHSDSECAPGQVCFADGCGDPGKDLVVEVTPNPKAGLHAQDFAIDLREAHPELQLRGPAVLSGQVLRQTNLTDADGGVMEATELYAGPVTVRATGESLLLPGVQRRYESTVVPEGGQYRFPVGVGAFSVSLVPGDATLPPQTESRSVEVGAQVALDFRLPAPEQLTQLAGVLVREPVPTLDADMEVQLLDASLKPLSQRVPVDRATGAFTLFLSPAARSLPQVLLQATPSAADSLLPQRTFTFDPKLPPATFSLGDFGAATVLTGSVLGPEGLPVVGAAVRVEGAVDGGGVFRSSTVTTDLQGRFSLPSLPSPAGQDFKLIIAPVARPLVGDRRAGITQVPVRVFPGGAEVNVICSARGLVSGTVLRPPPAGGAAPGVRILAQPVGPVAGLSAPSEGPQTVTDEAGRFELLLDPAEYRLDFVPGEDLPRVSRYVTVAPQPGTAGIAPQDLGAFSLSQGRSISGPVLSADPAAASPYLPYASIRFFRVVSVNGRLTSQLLAQTVSDANGQYAVTLPTR